MEKRTLYFHAQYDVFLLFFVLFFFGSPPITKEIMEFVIEGSH